MNKTIRLRRDNSFKVTANKLIFKHKQTNQLIPKRMKVFNNILNAHCANKRKQNMSMILHK